MLFHSPEVSGPNEREFLPLERGLTHLLGLLNVADQAFFLGREVPFVADDKDRSRARVAGGYGLVFTTAFLTNTLRSMRIRILGFACLSSKAIS